MKSFVNERPSVDSQTSSSYLHSVVAFKENLKFLAPDAEMRIPIEEAVSALAKSRNFDI